METMSDWIAVAALVAWILLGVAWWEGYFDTEWTVTVPIEQVTSNTACTTSGLSSAGEVCYQIIKHQYGDKSYTCVLDEEELKKGRIALFHCAKLPAD